jgi:hypothetical protein
MELLDFCHTFQAFCQFAWFEVALHRGARMFFVLLFICFTISSHEFS